MESIVSHSIRAQARRAVLAVLLAVSILAAGSVSAQDARLMRPGVTPTAVVAGSKVPGSSDPATGFRMLQDDVADGGVVDPGPSPFLAGLMSGLIPGSGQLIQGKSRGWVYLGVEIAAWFATLSLNSAGDQAITDARRFADGHYSLERYDTVNECGDDVGPVDKETESAVLHDNYDNNRDAYYDDIGSQDVYACGWDDQAVTGGANRSQYNDLRGEADGLHTGADIAVGVIVVNHLVSAVDAARIAANRRRQVSDGALDLRVSPDPGGLLAFQVQMHRTF